ncbi:MAG: DUF131 domain-containing protein [Thermoplasmata archaeon]|nr:DUF131 domain-containing protein [Thermoplasmata archaeon]
MMRWERSVAPLLLFTGALLIAYSVATGQARFYLVLVVPVVTGSSVVLVLGAVALVVGFLLLPWTFSREEEERSHDEPPTRRPPSSPNETSGGLVLVGPVPLFFGSWRSPTRARYWLAVALGLTLIVAFAALLLFV